MDYLKINQKAWDKKAGLHYVSQFYDIADSNHPAPQIFSIQGTRIDE